MEFEFWAAVAFLCMVAAAVLDWPRALAGLIWGAVCIFIPYATLILPAGVIALSAVAEFLYVYFGRAEHATWSGFFLGVFSVAGTASSLYITARNMKDRL